MNFSIYQYGMEYVTLFGMDYMGVNVRQVSYLPEEVQAKVRSTIVKTDEIKDLKIWLDARSITQCMFTAYIGDDVYHVDTTAEVPVAKEGEEAPVHDEVNTQPESPEPEMPPNQEEVKEESMETKEQETTQEVNTVEDVKQESEFPASSQVLKTEDKPLEPVGHNHVTAKVQPTGFDMSFITPPTIVGRRRSRARDVTPTGMQRNTEKTESEDEGYGVPNVENTAQGVQSVDVKNEPSNEVKAFDEANKSFNHTVADVPTHKELENVSREVLEAPDENFSDVMSGAYSTGRKPEVEVKKNKINDSDWTIPKEEKDYTTEKVTREERGNKHASEVMISEDIRQYKTAVEAEPEQKTEIAVQEPELDAEEESTESLKMETETHYNPVLLQHIDNYSVREIDMELVMSVGDTYCKENGWFQCDNIFMIDDVSRSLRCVHSDSHQLHLTIPYSEVMKFGGH